MPEEFDFWAEYDFTKDTALGWMDYTKTNLNGAEVYYAGEHFYSSGDQSPTIKIDGQEYTSQTKSFFTDYIMHFKCYREERHSRLFNAETEGGMRARAAATQGLKHARARYEKHL